MSQLESKQVNLPVDIGVYAFARTQGGGTLVESVGLSVVRDGIGTYTYTFSQPIGDSDYIVIGNPFFTTTDTNVQVSAVTPTTFTVQLGVGDNGTGADTLTDTEHSVVVFTANGSPAGISSAYQTWLNVGNVGTEVDFINDLVGPTGPPGADGQDGTNFNDQLFGTGVPSNALGNDGDIYFDNNNGDLYLKVAGSWVFQQNLAGGGTAVVRSVSATMNAQTDINSSSTPGVDLSSLNTTPLVDTGAGLYTVASTGITVTSDGSYEAKANIFMTSAAQRASVAIEFIVNGTSQGIRSASGYIRNASPGPHDNASTSLSQILDLTSGDEVAIRFFQASNTGTVTMPAGQSSLELKRLS